MQRETAEVKITYAPTVESSKVVERGFEAKGAREQQFENLLGLIQDTKKDLLNQEGTREKIDHVVKVQAPLPSNGGAFDYLDYKENEERLDRLRN